VLASIRVRDPRVNDGTNSYGVVELGIAASASDYPRRNSARRKTLRAGTRHTRDTFATDPSKEFLHKSPVLADGAGVILP
jgi:hypothetical protein